MHNSVIPTGAERGERSGARSSSRSQLKFTTSGSPHHKTTTTVPLSACPEQTKQRTPASTRGLAPNRWARSDGRKPLLHGRRLPSPSSRLCGKAHRRCEDAKIRQNEQSRVGGVFRLTLDRLP